MWEARLPLGPFTCNPLPPTFSHCLPGCQVKPSTESGRDAMLRHAVSAAIAAALSGSDMLLGGDPPAK